MSTFVDNMTNEQAIMELAKMGIKFPGTVTNKS